MWALSGAESVGGERDLRVYTTEDGAYAAAGRRMLLAGHTGDLEIVEVEVVGTGGDAPIPPRWMTRWYPGARFGSVGEAVVILDPDDQQTSTLLNVGGGATSTEDAECAAFLAALLNRELGR